MITLLSSVMALPSIVLLYRGLRDERLSRSLNGRWLVRLYWGFVLLMLCGGLLGEGTATVLIFIVAPLTYLLFLRSRLAPWILRVAKSWWGMAALTFLLLYPLDLAVGFDAGQDLFTHMRAVFGFYVGLSLTLTGLFRRYAYTPLEVFVGGGLLGLLVEQNFLGPTLLLTNPLGFVIFAPTIFLTYALYLLGPYGLFWETLHTLSRKQTRLQFVGLLLAVTIMPLLVWYFINTIFVALGMLPPEMKT